MSTTALPTAPPTIVWFRRDLRVSDNPALNAAASAGGSVIPVYVHDENGPPRPPGAATRWWLNRSLKALAADLRALGSELILRRGDSRQVLLELAEMVGATRVVWNRLYDQGSIDRDRLIADALKARGVEGATYNAGLLNEPEAVLTGGGGPYKVFTPYWRAARQAAGAKRPASGPTRLQPPAKPILSETLASWNFHPSKPDWSKGFEEWTPGEVGAKARLLTFLDGSAGDYARGRNIMGAAGVSRLSPHLHFGEIGPRQVWAAVEQAAERGAIAHAEAETFQKELGWREFNHALLFHTPTITRQSFNPAFERFQWANDPQGLAAWSRGATGYPIVDAAMRQLWSIGWMHNRARMIAASFLVKDLMIDWRVGEAWFWDTLVDADLANNVANWQWVAGSGADAAPFFRIFNPVLQGAKFDPDGAYVRRWVPELGALPNKDIHQPWNAAPETLRQAGVTLGSDYPLPIVDHSAARVRALAAYSRLS